MTRRLQIRALGAGAPQPETLLACGHPADRAAALASGPGSPELNRWSVLGLDPRGITDDFDVADRFASAIEPVGLREALPFDPEDTLPLLTGAIGYVSYDAGWRFAVRPRAPRPHPLGLPEVRFGLFDAVYLFDHHEGRAYVAHRPEAEARTRADALMALAERTDGSRPSPQGGLTGPLTPGVPRAEHEARIRLARRFIADGDVYQVNLTYPLLGTYRGDPRAAFRRLGAAAPPFAAYLGLGAGRAIVSASPECFLTLRREDRFARTYPIKGTRPRSEDPGSDRAEAEALLASEKDRAEHLMIVDLLRNDLGRLARGGGVRVESAAYLESFPTVHHLTSRIEAWLEPDRSDADTFRGLFPGGSITGAPKLRAMEIIDRLEGAPRGIYTGSIVALGPLGLVANIAIRTAEIVDEKIRVGIGGGIVWDSEPAAEWAETEVKARAISTALTGPS